MCFYVNISWIYFSTYTWYAFKFKLSIYEIYCIHFSFSIFKQWLIFFSIQQSLSFYAYVIKIPLGKSKNDLRCLTKSRVEIAQMAFEFRQNNSDEWRSFLKVNESGSFPTNNRNDINILSIGDCSLSYHSCSIYASILQYHCPSYSESYPRFRCQVFNESLHVGISDEVKVQIRGKFCMLFIFELMSNFKKGLN